MMVAPLFVINMCLNFVYVKKKEKSSHFWQKTKSSYIRYEKEWYATVELLQ